MGGLSDGIYSQRRALCNLQGPSSSIFTPVRGFYKSGALERRLELGKLLIPSKESSFLFERIR